MADLEPLPYSDAKIRSILERVKTIAMVGASPNWNRPSYFVMKYLQGKGYRVIPVNPAIAGKTLLGEQAYASLGDIPDKVDMVDMFRTSEEAPGVVADAVAIGAKVVWMQLGVRNDSAAKTAEGAGIDTISSAAKRRMSMAPTPKKKGSPLASTQTKRPRRPSMASRAFSIGEGQVIVSAFIYVAVEGHMFYLQFVPASLAPVLDRFRMGGSNPDSLRATALLRKLRGLAPGGREYGRRRA